MGVFPILFNFRPSLSDKWLENVVSINSGEDGLKNRVDGVKLLIRILADGQNYSSTCISIPKEASIRSKG